mgnify:CR=1 FL=1
MVDRVEPSLVGRWLDPPGEPAAFAPTPAAICGGCGLGVGRTASLVREPGSGTALCPICHLPWTQHLSLLRDTLLALPDSERASALPVLAGLRYLPNPRHPPLGVFFRRLLTELDAAD